MIPTAAKATGRDFTEKIEQADIYVGILSAFFSAACKYNDKRKEENAKKKEETIISDQYTIKQHHPTRGRETY